MKDLEYYSTVPVKAPRRDDYNLVFVYSRGKTLVNGAKRSDISEDHMAEYREKNYTIEIGFDKDAYFAAQRQYGSVRDALIAEFKADLFAENDISGARAEAAYRIAAQERGGNGFQEIQDLFEDIAALFKIKA
jgi:hypothetical protein